MTAVVSATENAALMAALEFQVNDPPAIETVRAPTEASPAKLW